MIARYQFTVFYLTGIHEGAFNVNHQISFKQGKQTQTCRQYKLTDMAPFTNTAKIRQLAIYKDRDNLKNLSTDSRYRDVSVYIFGLIILNSSVK